MTERPGDLPYDERVGFEEDEAERQRGLEARAEWNTPAGVAQITSLSQAERDYIRRHEGTLSVAGKTLRALEMLEAKYQKAIKGTDLEAKRAELMAVHEDLGKHVEALRHMEMAHALLVGTKAEKEKEIASLQERVAFAEKERDEAVAAKVAALHAHKQRAEQLGEQIQRAKRERDQAYEMLAKETAEHTKTRTDRDNWKATSLLK